MAGPSSFVGNISFKATHRGVKQLFQSPLGEVDAVNIRTDRVNGEIARFRFRHLHHRLDAWVRSGGAGVDGAKGAAAWRVAANQFETRKYLYCKRFIRGGIVITVVWPYR